MSLLSLWSVRRHDTDANHRRAPTLCRMLVALKLHFCWTNERQSFGTENGLGRSFTEGYILHHRMQFDSIIQILSRIIQCFWSRIEELWVWDDRYGWCLCLFISPQRQADPNYIITHKLVYLSGRCSCIAWISGTVYLILLFNWVLSFPCLCFLWSNSIKTYIFLLYKTIFNFSF